MRPISTLTLHRYRMGELSPEEAAQVRAALAANPADQARLQAQEALRAEFALRPVPAAIRDLRKKPSIWSFWRLPAMAAAAALALVMFLPGPQPDHGIRWKGDQAQVDVLVEGRGLLDPGERLRAGDRVQLRLPPGPYVEAWVSDGSRVLGRFDLSAEHATLAPFSLTLDDAPGEERLVVLLSSRRLAPDRVPWLVAGEHLSGVERVTIRLPKVR